jgi:hypothetical protein
MNSPTAEIHDAEEKVRISIRIVNEMNASIDAALPEHIKQSRLAVKRAADELLSQALRQRDEVYEKYGLL